MTTLYVTGKHKHTVQQVQQMCVDAGYTISYDWTKEQYDGPDNDPLAKSDYKARCARKALDGIFNADAVLVLNSFLNLEAYVEIGAALAYGRTVYVVDQGAGDCIFMHLSAQDGVRTFEGLKEALAALKEDNNA